MELTDEIKAKVLAQYIGANCKVTNNKYINGGYTGKVMGVCSVRGLLIEHISGSDGEENIDDCKLILKPLSAISDEDNIELYRLLGFKDAKGSNSPELRFEYYGNIINGSERVTFETATKFYQFLQSKGYDLPQFLLDGKTLQEAGLAIYE